MRFLRSSVLVCFALILASSVPAQSTATAPATSDPQAVALVQNSLAALTNGAAVTDVTLTGSARRIAGSDDETGTATLEATSLGDSRMELAFASGNRIEIRNHSATPLANALPLGITLPAAATQPHPVGAWSGPDGVLHGMVARDTLTEPAWFFPAIAVAHIADSPVWVLTYMGPETHDGASVIHVQATEQIPSSSNAPQQFVDSIRQLTRTDLYFDPTSSLLLALDFNSHPQTNFLIDIPVEIRFSNYQMVNGVDVPMLVQKFINNSPVLDLQFSNTALNSGLSSSVFALQ